MKKVTFLFCLTMVLLTLTLYSCQKSDSGQLSGDTAKASQTPGSEVGAEDRECSTCVWFFDVSVGSKGDYAATLETQACEGPVWINPITLFGPGSSGQYVTVGHDMLFRAVIHNNANFERKFTCNLYNPDPPYGQITTGKVTVPPHFTVIAPFNDRTSCSCNWRYNCSEE